MAAKFFRFDWSYLDRLAEIEPGSLEEIRLLLRYAGTTDLPDPLQTFFSMALAPFLDPRTCEQGRSMPVLPVLAGNVLYRLADLVPEQRRPFVVIFTTESGTDFSLQDWREIWVANFKKGEESIPYFAGGDPLELPGAAARI
jgi:hypothetical protein